MENTIFNNLNKKQMQIVNEVDNNILLSASAGTGKTNTLLCRIIKIIQDKRALPEEILCLTFTNKACKEIQERAVAMLGDDGSNIPIKTFHAFCYDIVKAEVKKHSDLFTDFIIFDEDDCIDIVRDLNKYNFMLKSLQNFINLAKEYRAVYDIYSEDILDDYKKVIYRLYIEENKRIDKICVNAHYFTDNKMKAWLKAEGAEFVCDYNSQLQKMHGLDFTDLISTAYQFFRNSEILNIWQKKYKYLNIDEMQDTSELEYKIISQLFANNNILLCGDYFQTIYEWRGSNPTTILDKYVQDYKPQIVVFDENYRATKLLLEASYGCLNNLFGEKVHDVYKYKIKAASEQNGTKIILHESKAAMQEAQWLYNQIKKLNLADISRIGILTRSNKYNQRLSENFHLINSDLPEDEKLNFILVDEFKFFRRQEIKDVIAFLRLLLNKYDAASFKRVLQKFAAGIGTRTIETIESDEYRKVGISLTDFIDNKIYEEAIDPFAVLTQALDKENIIVFDVESTGTDTSRDEIIQIAAIKIDRSGKVKDKFVRILQSDKPVGSSYEVHGFSDEYLREHGENPEIVLQEFVEYSRDAVIVGHNVGYDISILSSQLNRLKLKKIAFLTFYDTLDIFRRFYPNLLNHKLGYLSDYFAIEDKPTHNALDDVLATAALLIYAIDINIKPTAEKRIEYIARYIDQFRWIAVQMQELAANSHIVRPYDLIAKIMNVTRIKEYYRKQPERIERIRELYLIAKDIDDNKMNSRDALENLLKLTALSNSEMDRIILKRPRIPIITIHQSKGTEFDYVFLAGMQDGIFPAYLAIKEGNIEEEKRLFYVAITRAKKQLFISWSKISEHNRLNKISRFIKAIPAEFVVEDNK